jgi:hypothetical protein
MVNNSTVSTKMIRHRSPQIIEYKKKHDKRRHRSSKFNEAIQRIPSLHNLSIARVMFRFGRVFLHIVCTENSLNGFVKFATSVPPKFIIKEQKLTISLGMRIMSTFGVKQQSFVCLIWIDYLVLVLARVRHVFTINHVFS